MPQSDSLGVSARPLLSLTIPTYNRSVFLTELLECLLPQLMRGGVPDERVELVISDNASPDDTPAVVEQFRGRGLTIRAIRNAENIGPDGNFLQCLNLARGKYVWLMGDDDLLAPNTIPRLLTLLEREEYSVVYLSSLGFTGDARPTATHDPFGRFAERVTDGAFFMEKVNAMITLISANIVNKDILLATPHPPIPSLNNTNLLQLGWMLPVIHRECRILYVWERVLYHRTFNSGGWGICEVFGVRFHAIATRYFAAEPMLGRKLMNGVLGMWLPDHILQMRRGALTTMQLEPFTKVLAPVFSGNWRYWLLVYPVANFPLPLATLVSRLTRTAIRAVRLVRTTLHFVLRRGDLLWP
jgi:abequosyltransferase